MHTGRIRFNYCSSLICNESRDLEINGEKLPKFGDIYFHVECTSTSHDLKFIS
jgi:hypothetical protein